MTDQELCTNAVAFTTVPTFYEYGGWGQEMTRNELDRLAARYPKNKPVNYDNVGKWGFDCICMIKGLLAGVTTTHHVNSYTEMAKNPIGDCTNVEFYKMLYDCVPASEAPAGYGLATEKHAALSLGGGKWIDCNRITGKQDGVAVHWGGLEGFKAGKIPGVDYNAAPSDQKAILMSFCEWLVDSYLNRVM